MNKSNDKTKPIFQNPNNKTIKLIQSMLSDLAQDLAQKLYIYIYIHIHTPTSFTWFRGNVIVLEASTREWASWLWHLHKTNGEWLMSCFLFFFVYFMQSSIWPIVIYILHLHLLFHYNNNSSYLVSSQGECINTCMITSLASIVGPVSRAFISNHSL